MGKLIETKINRFDGGITNSLRATSVNEFNFAKHFDIFSDETRLIPQVATTAATTGQDTVGNFLYTSNNYLLGLGIITGQTYPCIYYKTGGALISDGWAGTTSNWQGAQGNVQYDCFVEHKEAGGTYFYFWDSGHLILGDTTFSAPLNETFKSVSHTSVAQGLVHSANGTLYLPYDNKIASITTASAWDDDAAPSIDASYTITAICEFGSYLAIACVKGGGIFNSKVFIWDMVATSFTEVIDWGDEALNVLNNLDGYLFGVSSFGNSALAKVPNRKRVVVKQSSGSRPQTIAEIYPDPLVTSGNVYLYQRVNFINKDKLYFSVNFDSVTGGESRCGLYCIGRNKTGRYVVSLDRVATDDNSDNGILAAIIVGDTCFMVHTAEGTLTRQLTDAPTYGATSVYESQIFDGRIHGFDPSYTKKLIGASVQHAKLPTDGSVVLKYRQDGASSWTTILTNTTDDSLSSEAINISGETLPEYKEIQFRIESTGGGEITGFSFKEEIIDKRLY